MITMIKFQGNWKTSVDSFVAHVSSYTCDGLVGNPCCKLGQKKYSQHEHTRTEIFWCNAQYPSPIITHTPPMKDCVL